MTDQVGINYPAAPLPNVWLQNGYEISDGVRGKTIRYANLPNLGAAIVRAVVLKCGRLNGAEISYLRRRLDLSQVQCAGLLGMEEQTFSLWERGKYPIPAATDALFRRICVEELRSIFPRTVSIPKTVGLVRLASPLIKGDFVATFEQNIWAVSYIASAPDQVVAETVTDAKVVTLSGVFNVNHHRLTERQTRTIARLTKSYRLAATHANFYELAVLDEIVGKIPMRMQDKTVTGITASNFVTADASGSVDDVYMVNPATGTLFKAMNPAKPKKRNLVVKELA